MPATFFQFFSKHPKEVGKETSHQRIALLLYFQGKFFFSDFTVFSALLTKFFTHKFRNFLILPTDSKILKIVDRNASTKSMKKKFFFQKKLCGETTLNFLQFEVLFVFLSFLVAEIEVEEVLMFQWDLRFSRLHNHS